MFAARRRHLDALTARAGTGAIAPPTGERRIARLRIVCRGSAARSAALGRNHRRNDQRGLARRDLRRLLHRQMRIAERERPARITGTSRSSEVSRLDAALAVLEIACGSASASIARARRADMPSAAQDGERSPMQSLYRVMPEQPDHRGTGQGQNRQETDVYSPA